MAGNGHRHILFVDDDADIREVVENRLELAGISVTTAEDGIDALHHLETGLFPDIIISDIQMPNMDGFAFFSTVRQNEEWLEIPFVGLTEDMDGTIARRARILGMTDFLRKPFDSDELLETIYSKTKDKPNGEAKSERSQQATPQTLSRPREIETSRFEGRSDYARFENAPVIVDDSPTMSRPMPVTTKHASSSSAVTSASAGTELKSYFRVLLWYKWVIIVCTVVAVGLSFVASSLITPKYSASATLRVASASGGVVDYGSLALSSRLMNTYREIATSGPVIDELNKRLGIEVSPAISVDSIVETELFTITATDKDPQIAKDAANIMADIMVERSLELYSGTTETYRQYLEDQLQEAENNYQQAVRAYEVAIEDAQTVQDGATPNANGTTPDSALVTAKLDILQKRVELFQQIYQDRLDRYENALVSEQLRANAISVVEPAYYPTSPSSPKKVFNAILGFGAGLIGGVGLAFLLETFKNAFRTIEDVQNVTSLPILAQVPNRAGGPLNMIRRRKRESFLTQKTKPSFFEPYHRMRVTLLGSRAISKGDTILLASAEPGAGKSTTTGNLGVAMAETGNRVILIDADFPRSGLTRMFNQSGKPGLGEVLLGQRTLAETIQDTQWPTLGFLPAGAVTDEITGRLSGDMFEEVLAQLRQLYDYIIVDSPALLSIADATVVAKQADAVVVIVSIRHSQPNELRLALQQLGDVNAKTVGLVINRAPKTRVYSYYARR
ncbi:MAG: polysaccharide biosynthesis tyrosine autokinase [Chloroflexi bacterium]|nr:polysaccharide biosynthesis tyrosine autokinase [Chloroflexota bacterium]